MGFHILLVEEIKKEDNRQLFRLRQIFTRKITFADFLAEKMRGMAVIILSPDYEWNVEEARVEFKKQELRDFEKNLFLLSLFIPILEERRHRFVLSRDCSDKKKPSLGISKCIPSHSFESFNTC